MMADLRIDGALPLPLEQSLQQKPMGGEGFGKILNDAVGNINRLDREANRSIAELLEGKADVHEVMVASQKVDLSMRLLLTVRNKVIEAYREIMHMQF
jgi:flagellar hook-basal body complex protein FliE